MTMQMSTKDVETVYDFCRKLAPLLRQGMDILTGQILDYQKTGDVASLKPVLFNFYDDLGISVPRNPAGDEKARHGFRDTDSRILTVD